MTYNYTAGPASSEPDPNSSSAEDKGQRDGFVPHGASRVRALGSGRRKAGYIVGGVVAAIVVIVATCVLVWNVIPFATRTEGGGSDAGAAASGNGRYQGDDLSRYNHLLRECQLMPPEDMAKILGGGAVMNTFNGAICRWQAIGPRGSIDVTFTWFEWGRVQVESETDRRLGYAVTPIKLHASSAYQVTIPSQPSTCGVFAASPTSGTVQFWVQPRSDIGNSCAMAGQLMERVLDMAL